MLAFVAAVILRSAGNAGVAEREITLMPPEPLPLGGYTARNGARFEPGGETLRARCIVLGSTALVTVEMLTAPESLVAEVQKRVGTEFRVVLIATHTHCAPDSQMLNVRMTVPVPGIATFQRRWLNWYADRIAQLIRDALELDSASLDLGPSEDFRIRTAHVPLARARRKEAAPIERAVQISAGSQTLLSVFAAHPTLYDEKELRTRGDWPGKWMSLTSGLVATGAIGDASPVPPLSRGSAEAQCSAFARSLQQGLEQSPWRPIGSGFEVREFDIVLPPVTAHPEFAPTYKVTPQIAQVVVERFAPPSAKVTLMRFGTTLVIGVPGEPTAGLARRMMTLAATRGFSSSVVLSHVNGWIGYLLEKEDYERGGYEATLGFHGPGAAEAVLNAVKEGLRTMELNPAPGDL